MDAYPGRRSLQPWPRVYSVTRCVCMRMELPAMHAAFVSLELTDRILFVLLALTPQLLSR